MKYLVCTARREMQVYSLMEAESLAKRMLLNYSVCWEAVEGATIYNLTGDKVALEEKITPDFMDKAQVQSVCNLSLSVSKSKGVGVLIEGFKDATPTEWLKAFDEALDELGMMVNFDDYKPMFYITHDGVITSGELRGKVKVGDKTFTYDSDYVVVDDDKYSYFLRPIYLRREKC